MNRDKLDGGKFPVRLKEKRLELGLDIEELYKRSGVNDVMIRQYEEGVSRPSFDSLIKLCVTMNVSADYLLGLSDASEDYEPNIIADGDYLWMSANSSNSSKESEDSSISDKLSAINDGVKRNNQVITKLAIIGAFVAGFVVLSLLPIIYSN
jgi:transcriptional regulator with XRE-family HTH domain